MFQFASTALTVTLNAAPAIWAEGVPVFPVAVPGAASSPGASNCSFTNAPELTVMEELVLAVLVPSLTSLAVTVRVPVLLSVTVKVWLPPAHAALDGKGGRVCAAVVVCGPTLEGLAAARPAGVWRAGWLCCEPPGGRGPAKPLR